VKGGGGTNEVPVGVYVMVDVVNIDSLDLVVTELVFIGEVVAVAVVVVLVLILVEELGVGVVIVVPLTLRQKAFTSLKVAAEGLA